MKKSSFILLSLATSLVISNQAPAATPMTLVNHTGHTINVSFSHCRVAGSYCTFERINQIQADSSHNQLSLMAPMNLDTLFIQHVDAIDDSGKVISKTASACRAPISASTVNFTNEGSTITCEYSRTKA